MADKPQKKPKVYLVGAGPGRADLITVRAAELLKIADCVIYDRLINPALLELAPAQAEIVPVPKRVGAAGFTQEEINKLIVDKARTGKTIVRLKGGDPCVFGRLGEEAAAVAEAGLDYEIVPGVTAGTAAAAYTGIIPTHRKYSSQLLFVTGRQAADKQPDIDWHRLAKFNGTIIFYMAVGSLKPIISELIKSGMSPQMPAAAIADATLPTQKMVKTGLKALRQECLKQQIEPPAVIIIGPAAAIDDKLNWFMKLPLFGKNIVLTRHREGNLRFAEKIIASGGNPVELPVIAVKPLTWTNAFLRIVARVAEFDWLIFTSPTAVTLFFDLLKRLQKDARVFGRAKIAAIGSETAAVLYGFGLRADFVPSVYTSRELGRQLANRVVLAGKKVLLLRSKLAGSELAEIVTNAGAVVETAPVYTVEKKTCRTKPLEEKIATGLIHYLTFASSSSVTAFFDQVSVDVVNSSSAKVAAIGPVTGEKLNSLSVKVDVTAKQYTIDGLLNAIMAAEVCQVNPTI